MENIESPVKRTIFKLEKNTELEFLNQKRIVDKKVIKKIDKERFLICKQLMIQNAEGNVCSNSNNKKFK